MSTIFTHQILYVGPYLHDPVLGVGTERVSDRLHCSVAVLRPVVFTFAKICANKFEDPESVIGFSLELYMNVLITTPGLAYVCRGKNVALFPNFILNIRRIYVPRQDKILTIYHEHVKKRNKRRNLIGNAPGQKGPWGECSSRRTAFSYEKRDHQIQAGI
jgi:hypothetical protein